MITSVNAQGESSPSEEVLASPKALPNMVPNGGFETDAVGGAPAGWQMPDGTWAITDETAFDGVRCLKGSYDRKNHNCLGPSIGFVGPITAGRYRVEMMVASDHPVSSPAVAIRSPRVHLFYGTDNQTIYDVDGRYDPPVEKNGKSWVRVWRDFTLPEPGKDLPKSLGMDMFAPLGSGTPDPTTVWVDDVRAYRYEPAIAAR